MQILIVEDEIKVANLIGDALTDAGYTSDIEYSGFGAIEALARRAYDLVILDHLLPGITGRELCVKLRSEGNVTPILMVTARAAVSDRISGLDSGADDYLTKPFHIEELLARVRALLRRQESASATIFTVHDLAVNSSNRSVVRAGKPVDLSAKEYDLLELLIKHAGRTVTKAAIAEQVWGLDFDPGSNVVEVYISYLRGKIDQKSSQKLITTVRGVGYQLG